jgi:hypothetical protein
VESVGDFAESLILQDLEDVKEGKKSSFDGEGVAADPSMPDISQIDLDSVQVGKMILGENISQELQEDTISIAPPPKKEKKVSSDPISYLVDRLSHLVEQAESLVSRLDEMTGVGSLGAVQKFNLLKPEKSPPLPSVMNRVKKLRKYRRK